MQIDNSCRKLLLEFFSHLKLLHFARVSQNCHGMSLVGPSHTNLEGHPRTVLGCPMWDPLDTKSHQS